MTLPMVSAAPAAYTGSSPGKAVEGCFSIALPCACTFTERNRGQFKLLPNWWASIYFYNHEHIPLATKMVPYGSSIWHPSQIVPKFCLLGRGRHRALSSLWDTSFCRMGIVKNDTDRKGRKQLFKIGFNGSAERASQGTWGSALHLPRSYAEQNRSFASIFRRGI